MKHLQVLLYSFLMNILYNLWIQLSVERHSTWAAMADGGIVLFNALMAAEYVHNRKLIPAAVLGAILSTYLVVEFWR